LYSATTVQLVKYNSTANFIYNIYNGSLKVMYASKFTPLHAVKVYGGEQKLHLFLALAPDRDEWSTSRPVRFTPGTHCIEGGWVGPKEGLNILEKRKISCP
jgi:hypothetical protein